MWIPVFSRLQNRTFSTPPWAFTHTLSCTAAWRETDGGQRHLSRAPHHTVEEQCVTQHITRNGFAITWICIIANAPCLRCSAGRYYQVSRRMSVSVHQSDKLEEEVWGSKCSGEQHLICLLKNWLPTKPISVWFEQNWWILWSKYLGDVIDNYKNLLEPLFQLLQSSRPRPSAQFSSGTVTWV